MDARTRTYVVSGGIIVVLLLLFFRRKSSSQVIQEMTGEAIYKIAGPTINEYELPALPEIFFPPFAGGDVINFQLPDLSRDGFDISKLFGHAWDWMQTTDLACGCGEAAYQPAVWITIKQPTPPPVTQFVYLTAAPSLPSQPVVSKPATPKTLHFARASGMSVG